MLQQKSCLWIISHLLYLFLEPEKTQPLSIFFRNGSFEFCHYLLMICPLEKEALEEGHYKTQYKIQSQLVLQIGMGDSVRSNLLSDFTVHLF